MQAYDKAAPVVKDATDTATPYVKKGLDVAGEVARPVIRAAEPIVKVRKSPVDVHSHPLLGHILHAGAALSFEGGAYEVLSIIVAVCVQS